MSLSLQSADPQLYFQSIGHVLRLSLLSAQQVQLLVQLFNVHFNLRGSVGC